MGTSTGANRSTRKTWPERTCRCRCCRYVACASWAIRVAAEDQNAYVHLWNVASYLMGVDERLLPDTGKEAFWLTKLISERHHRPSEAGRVLTKSLLT